MTSFHFGQRSRRELETVRCELRAIARRALVLSPVDFGVIDGARTIEQQEQHVASGASLTLDSKHVVGIGRDESDAIDVVAWTGGAISWEWKYYQQIALVMKQAANELNLKLVWGGDWENFKDGGHFELEEV